jgi:hypothetical protein
MPIITKPIFDTIPMPPVKMMSRAITAIMEMLVKMITPG